jgi:hypothetical protein
MILISILWHMVDFANITAREMHDHLLRTYVKIIYVDL